MRFLRTLKHPPRPYCTLSGSGKATASGILTVQVFTTAATPTNIYPLQVLTTSSQTTTQRFVK